MIPRKTIFIIPGFKHYPTQKAYKDLAKLLKNEGFFPILVKIPWKNSTISQNANFFLKKYKKVRTKNKCILGFSFGAMIAFVASTKVKPSALILCSLSPYFKEDFLRDKALNSNVSKKSYLDFLELDFNSLSKKIKTNRALILYGTEESSLLIQRVWDAFHTISSLNKYIIPIYETEHDLSDKRYLHSIHQVIKGLQ